MMREVQLACLRETGFDIYYFLPKLSLPTWNDSGKL